MASQTFVTGQVLTAAQMNTLNNALDGFTTTATAVGTTVLTAASTHGQVFTGVTTQTVTLPVASTMGGLGQNFRIINNSSGIVTVNSSGANLVSSVAANTEVTITVILLSGTTAASWDAKVTGQTTLAASGTTFVGAVLTIGGADVSINNAIDTAVIWTTQWINTDSINNLGVNPSRLTIPAGKTGKWLVSTQVCWSPNSVGYRATRIYKNGSLIKTAYFTSTGGTAAETHTLTEIVPLTAGDYIEIYVYQSSGAALNMLTNGGSLQPDATMINLAYLGA